MSTKYCNLCERKVEAKREIGVGSLLLVLLTGGLWLIAIIFYGERCSICKSKALVSEKGASTSNALPILLGILAFLFIMRVVVR